MRNLPDAPWAGQRVSPFVRVLALVFVMCGVFADVAMVYLPAVDGSSAGSSSWETLGALVGTGYLMCVFLFVGLRGRAPSGWIPWR